jgi:hypothetical protein
MWGIHQFGLRHLVSRIDLTDTKLCNSRYGIGHWALGIGHWALGIGHWALLITHYSLLITHYSPLSSLSPLSSFPCLPVTEKIKLRVHQNAC